MRRSFILGFSVFCIVWGARLGVVDRYGSDLPRMDQWDAEYGMMLAPHLQGSLGFRDLFIAHNEHVIACTKATALFLFSVNGQWDNRVECVVNAAIVALFAVGLVFVGRQMLGRVTRVIWLVVVVFLCALPVSLTNILSGFHSQQVYLIVFSLTGLALLLVCREWTNCWFVGLICGVLALFSMASGLLMAVAVVLALVPGRSAGARIRARLPTIVVCVLLAVAGFSFRGEAAWNASLHAQSVGEFFGTVWHALVWPVDFFPLYPLFGWLPWGWLGWQLVRSEEGGSPGERVVFAVGLWVLLQIAATAYARGAGVPDPSSRYLDTLAVGVGVNILALLMAFDRKTAKKTLSKVRRALLAVGVSLFAVGFSLHIGRVVFGSLSEYGERAREWEINVSAYLADGDPDHLTNREIPYISSERLIEYLEQPEIRAILPSSVRQEGPAGPLSVFAARVVDAGWLIAAVGGILWLLVLADEMRGLRRRAKVAAG